MSRKVLILAAIVAALPVVALAGTDDEVVVATPNAANTAAALAKAKTDPAAASSSSNASNATDPAPVQRAHVAVETDNGRSIHGSMGASIGTGGYRSAYMTALIPVGEDGTLGVAVNQTDFGKDGVYSYGRGYGRRLAGGHSTSVAVSLDMTGGSGTVKDDEPQGCAPGFRDGDHYVEPVWVTKLHHDKACEDGETTSALTGQVTAQSSHQP